MSSDATIYWALRRAERKLELPPGTVPLTMETAAQMGALLAIRAIREEIDNSMTHKAVPQIVFTE